MKLRADAVITVESVKKLLGDEALSMTENEIQDLIDDFDIIAQYTIKKVQEFKNKEKTIVAREQSINLNCSYNLSSR